MVVSKIFYFQPLPGEMIQFDSYFVATWLVPTPMSQNVHWKALLDEVQGSGKIWRTYVSTGLVQPPTRFYLLTEKNATVVRCLGTVILLFILWEEAYPLAFSSVRSWTPGNWCWGQSWGFCMLLALLRKLDVVDSVYGLFTVILRKTTPWILICWWEWNLY